MNKCFLVENIHGKRKLRRRQKNNVKSVIWLMGFYGHCDDIPGSVN